MKYFDADEKEVINPVVGRVYYDGDGNQVTALAEEVKPTESISKEEIATTVKETVTKVISDKEIAEAKETQKAKEDAFWEEIKKDAPAMKEKYGEELNIEKLEKVKHIIFLNKGIIMDKIDPNHKLTPAEMALSYQRMLEGKLNLTTSEGTTLSPNNIDRGGKNAEVDFNKLPPNYKASVEKDLIDLQAQWREMAETKKKNGETIDVDKFVTQKMETYKQNIVKDYKAMNG
jgi:hypothetical protein